MVFAIVSLVLSCVSLFIFWWLGLVGATFGVIGLATATDSNVQKGLSIAGIIVGVLSSVAMLILMLLL